jgi:two-component system phosphate regulon sensor histidine kinase PhoR
MGKVYLCLNIALIFFLAWHAYQFHRLLRWIESGNWLQPNNVGGAWGDLYGYYYRLKKRHKKRKKRLMNILQQFQQSAAAMPDGTLELGERGEILRWNTAAYHLLGLRKNKDVGVRVDNLIRTPTFTEYLQKADYKEAIVISSPVDDEIILSVQIVPYADRRRLMVARDITRLHRLEKMRQDFVANVSHEMKTPVTVLRGFIETMMDSGDEFVNKWSRSLNLMKEQTIRMQNVVEDLLFLSRLETKVSNLNGGNIVNVSAMLNLIRQEALALIDREHSDRDLQLKCEIDETLSLIGDETELRSAFTNLVTNAIYYSKPKGEVGISWKRVGDTAVFSVKDTGIGIPQEELHRVTERFYRIEKSRSRQSGGTGLGLSIVKHVLTRHQADLDITSEFNVGSTFSCVFPESRIATLDEPESALIVN